MGFFESLFGTNTEKLFSNTMDEYFNLWGVSRPTDEERLRMIFSLYLSSSACLNDLIHGHSLKNKIDKLGNVASNLSSPLKIKISDLFPNEISRISMQEFFDELPMPVSSPNTRLNGLAAFPALHPQGPKIIKEIMNSKDGPFGIMGYASVVIGEIVVGREKSMSSFSSSLTILPNFLKAI